MGTLGIFIMRKRGKRKIRNGKGMEMRMRISNKRFLTSTFSIPSFGIEPEQQSVDMTS